MKHIIVSTHDSLYPMTGGGALRTLKVAEEFKRRGNKVIIIGPTDGIGELKGIKVHWLHPPRKQRSQILSSLKFNIRLLRKFLQFAKDADIFFIHNTISAATLPFLKKIFKFAFVLDITDIHAEYLPVGKRNIIEKFLTPLLLKIEYWIIENADSITVATYAMQKLLIEKGVAEEKIRVVYDGAETDGISEAKEPGTNLNIIHLGTIDRQHGVEILIQAVPKVIQVYPQAKFLIVGGGRELHKIKELAKRLDVYQHCIFTGYLPYQEAREYLKKANIGAIVRQDKLPNRIVTTLKLFEYWASGTVVVSSRLEGIAEIARDKKDIIFFEPGNSKDFADKIIFLLKSQDLIVRLKQEGFSTVKRFNWQELAGQIVDHALRE